MDHQVQYSGLSLNPFQRAPIHRTWLWLEKEDKEESKRIGELKERQRQKQKAIEEQYRKRQEQAPQLSESKL